MRPMESMKRRRRPVGLGLNDGLEAVPTQQQKEDPEEDEDVEVSLLSSPSWNPPSNAQCLYIGGARAGAGRVA